MKSIQWSVISWQLILNFKFWTRNSACGGHGFAVLSPNMYGLQSDKMHKNPSNGIMLIAPAKIFVNFCLRQIVNVKFCCSYEQGDKKVLILRFSVKKTE